MKNPISIFLLLSLSLSSLAQTQQGIVKTKGRMVNGQYVKGRGLSGASVTIKGGNSYLVQNKNGSFSFPVPATTFLVQKVQKKGYELVDADITRRYHRYSANPLYLVMETPEQQMDDLLDAQKKISKTLREQLKKARAEIQQLKDENKITDDEYRQRLAQLMENQQNNQKLISDMAKEYAQMDYDQMDDKNKRISDAILNGRLTEADSLLRSKGDMNSRNQEIDRRLKIEAKEKEELAKRQENLSVSEAGTQKLLEDFANDCYKYFDMFKMENKRDSALYYIELRANRDTTNVEWQLDAGLFINNYIADYGKAMNYYHRALQQSIIQYGNESEWVAASYYNLGIVYYSQGDHTKALEYYGKALGIQEKALVTEDPEVAATYNNIGLVYYDQGEDIKALEYYSKALGIQEKALGTEDPEVAATYNNIGNVYRSQGDYPKALEYHGKALDIMKKVLDEEHPNVATTYNNIGSVYNRQGEDIKALEYFTKALDIMKKVLDEEHPNVAATYNNIGLVYSRQGEDIKALEYYTKALAIQEKVLSTEHPDVATTCNNIGLVYNRQGDHTKALEYHSKALDIREKVLSMDHPDIAATYNNIGLSYVGIKDFNKSLHYYLKAINVLEQRLSIMHSDLAVMYSNIAYVYEETKQYDKALDYLLKAINLLQSTKSSILINLYDSVSGIYRKLENYAKAGEYQKKAFYLLNNKE